METLKYKELLDSISRGQAVLFTGAGFNSNIENISGNSFPFSEQLRVSLLSQFNNLSGFEDAPLELISEKIVDDKKARELIHLLKDTFTISKNGDFIQSSIANLEWKRIYTTNYDDAIEHFIELSGKAVTPVTLSDRIQENYTSNMVVHLNGFIRNLTPRKLNTEFKLTSSSYVKSSLFMEQNDWERFFKNDLVTASCIVFIGVSLDYDLDIKRVLTNVGDLKNKIYFIDWYYVKKMDNLNVES